MRDEGTRNRAWGIAVAFALVCVLAGAGLASPVALAADNHVFDPTLSLRGDALTGATDEVPDPGPNHPPKSFYGPCGVATDSHGDIYVASGATEPPGTAGRIDIFSSDGKFLQEIPNEHQPCSLAVDSEGNLYAAQFADAKVTLYQPDSYPPSASTQYVGSTVFEGTFGCNALGAIAVDPSDDHLYIATACQVLERDSAANGSGALRSGIGEGLAVNMNGLDVCGRNHDVYVTATPANTAHPDQPSEQRLFSFDGTSGAKVIEASGPPGESFGFSFGKTGVAIDQANCDVYVNNVTGDGTVERFSAAGTFIGRLSHSLLTANPWGDIAIDDPCRTALGESCRVGEAYDSPNAGQVYVGSGGGPANSHLYSFSASETGPPQIEAQIASEINDTEALLHAKLSSEGLATNYRFEYTTQASFETQGFAGAASVPPGGVEAGATAAHSSVAAAAADLQPGTAYRFRLVAGNEDGETSGEGVPGGEGESAAFSTYESRPGGEPCPNAARRNSRSLQLPDCRAYELVTPSDTAGLAPTLLAIGGGQSGSFQGFYTSPTSANGNSLIFGTEGGSLPHTEANGYHDIYEAVRDEGGWHTRSAGLSGAQAQQPAPGGVSSDHGYSFWDVFGSRGTLAANIVNGAHYLRGPNGEISPVGTGSLATDLSARGKWISANGAHVIFTSGSGNNPAVQLEPEAAPSNTTAIYDRSSGEGPTRVISVKPNGGSFQAGENATYLGSAADGSAVAFEVGEAMYLRLDDSETREIAQGNTTFAGLSGDGRRLLYVKDGDIFLYDSVEAVTRAIGSGGESTVVNFSADGSHVFFVSPKQLDGSEGTPGDENLYSWNGASPGFIATLDPLDVSGREVNGNGTRAGGLGLWAPYGFATTLSGQEGPASDPSRSTPDGSVLVFESRAGLTPYDNAGHTEIYRYDSVRDDLACISCNRTGVAAVSDAQLQSDPALEFELFPPVNALINITNVTSDGNMVFFQSADRLAAGDNDGRIDVYEWEAQGSGGCARQDGCVRPISPGNNSGDDYLYGVTPDGHDVFFESSSLLSEQDGDGTPSIYDARVDGGFPLQTPPPRGCIGEACQAPAVAPPGTTPASSTFEGPENKGDNHKRNCLKRKHRTRASKGKSRCAKATHGGRHKSQKDGGKRRTSR